MLYFPFFSGFTKNEKLHFINLVEEFASGFADTETFLDENMKVSVYRHENIKVRQN